MAAEFLERLLAINLAGGGVALLLLLVGARLRRHFGARIAYAAWIAVPLVALATLLPARIVDAPAVHAAPVRPLAEAAVQIAVNSAPGPALIDWALIAVLVWASLAAILIAALAWAQVRALRRLGPLTREAGGVLRAGHPGAGPAVIGLLRPRIVLPSDFETRFNPREQSVILAHEQAHLASGDVRINAAVALARCLFWFNPLAHLAARRLRLDQELACDEAVIARRPQDRRVYGEALLKAQVAVSPLPFGCYWPSRSAWRLKERILLLTRKIPGRDRRLLGAVLIMLVALGVGFTVWTIKPPIERPAPVPAAPAPATRPTVATTAASFPPEVQALIVAEQARTDSAAAPALPAPADRLDSAEAQPAFVAVSSPAPGPPPPAPMPSGDPSARPPSSVQLLTTRGSELALFTCEPTAEPGRVICSAVPANSHDGMAAKAYARASELYRVALTRAPSPPAPIPVSCYWPSKAAVRKPWTRTPDWRCQTQTHLSVTAALARKAPPEARLLSYTCEPAQRSGLRSCSASVVFDVRADNPLVYALTIGGTPLAEAAQPQLQDVASN